MKLLGAGAEAVVYADRKSVVKQRQPKTYRVKELDDKLRLSRMRREVKVMESLRQQGINVPKVLEVDEKAAAITMQRVEGKKLRDVLEGSNYKGICREIGTAIGAMHQHNIVHGDLTTSNMIIDSKKRIWFIDFGLSAFSRREEDKAVDLHLFRQALESSHHLIAHGCFEAAIKAYKEANHCWKPVFERLEKVEARGRNKHKG